MIFKDTLSIPNGNEIYEISYTVNDYFSGQPDSDLCVELNNILCDGKVVSHLPECTSKTLHWMILSRLEEYLANKVEEYMENVYESNHYYDNIVVWK